MTERRPGTWYLRAWDRRSGQQVRRAFKGSKRKAESELVRLVAKVQVGDVALSGQLTVGDYLDRWLEQATPALQLAGK